MPKDWEETRETKDSTNTSESHSSLSSNGVRAMQGVEPESSADEVEATPTDELEQVIFDDMNELYDQSKWEYRKRSPHADHELYKAQLKAEREHEIGIRASTANSLADAVDVVLAAHLEKRASGERSMDRYFYQKYGTQPYTEDAYPQEEEE